jgi:hypothetical protein
MVAAKPTRLFDLERSRTHVWEQNHDGDVICRNCEVQLRMEEPLADLPACPGPHFVLTRRDDPSKGRHSK